MYIHTHVQTYTCTYIHKHRHTYMHTWIHVRTCRVAHNSHVQPSAVLLHTDSTAQTVDEFKDSVVQLLPSLGAVLVHRCRRLCGGGRRCTSRFSCVCTPWRLWMRGTRSSATWTKSTHTQQLVIRILAIGDYMLACTSLVLWPSQVCVRENQEGPVNFVT